MASCPKCGARRPRNRGGPPRCVRCGPFDRDAHEEIRPYPGPLVLLIWFLAAAFGWLLVVAVGKGMLDLAMAIKEIW